MSRGVGEEWKYVKRVLNLVLTRSLRHRGNLIIVKCRWVKEKEGEEGQQGGDGQHQHQADLVPEHRTVTLRNVHRK